MQTLSDDLQTNLNALGQLFHEPDNSDYVVRRLQAQGVEMAVLYIDGMSKRTNIEDMILRPLMKMRPFGHIAPENRAQALEQMVLPTGTSELTDQLPRIAEFILDGNCAVLCAGAAQAVLAEMQGYSTRSINQPQMENVTYGPHEAFTESIRTNLTQLHRTLRTSDLVVEMRAIGSESNTKVALVYLSGTTNKDLVAEARRRLDGIQVDKLLSIGQLQQLLEDRPFKLLPQMIQTERPDRTASFLMEGMFVLLCDNAPYAIAAPATFLSFLHAPDDHALRWQYGTFNRIVRLLGFLLTLLLPALYNAILLFHQEILPADLLTSILEGYTLVPLTITAELVLMDLIFDLINEASLRMPGGMSNTLGIVGGLVLGQAAVSANLISPLLIIIISVTGLGMFSIPSYPLALATRIARLMLLIASTIAGFAGICLALLYLICSAAAMESFGTPYFAPIAPALQHNPDLFTRLPVQFQKKKPSFARPQNDTAAKAPRGWTRRDPS